MKYTRTVVNVSDGDTIEVDREIEGTKRIRLADVIAPELDKPGGTEARNFLKGIVDDKEVSIEVVGRSYDRIVANVWVGEIGVNKRMQEKGYK